MSKKRKLLKKLNNLVEEQPNPKRESAFGAEDQPSALTERRKRALLTYLSLLFGAAFFVVAISLFVSWRSHMLTVAQLNSNTSNAVSRAEALQEENQALLQQMDELKASLEYSETSALEQIESVKLEAELSTRRVTEGYELLLWALEALENQDQETFTEALIRLEPLVDCLGEEGRYIYAELVAFDWSTVQPD